MTRRPFFPTSYGDYGLTVDEYMAAQKSGGSGDAADQEALRIAAEQAAGPIYSAGYDPAALTESVAKHMEKLQQKQRRKGTVQDLLDDLPPWAVPAGIGAGALLLLMALRPRRVYVSRGRY